MDATTSSAGRPRRVLQWLALLLSGTFMLGVAVLLVAGVVVPRFAGATPYVILTSSMRPTLPAGTIVVTRPVDPGDIGVGDVITYQLRSGEPEVVTHRVVAVSFTTAGDYLFTTQGDNNSLPDARPVRAVQVRGESWYGIPWLGRLTSLLGQDQRQALTWLLGGALLTYAGLAHVGALRDRRREVVA